MNVFQTGTMTATTAVVNVGVNDAPMTATLTSAAGGRQIELSSDGINYYVATPSASTAAMINVSITTPIAKVRFTGAINDVWSVR